MQGGGYRGAIWGLAADLDAVAGAGFSVGPHPLAQVDEQYSNFVRVIGDKSRLATILLTRVHFTFFARLSLEVRLASARFH